jgi:hypothetical protein
MRRARRTVQGAKVLSEEVLHYHRQLDISAERSDAAMPQDYWVRDILRLNMRHFLVRLDDPMDKVAYFDLAHRTFATAGFSRVYHVNLVVQTEHQIGAHVERRVEGFRVVLNQKGIVRVEGTGTQELACEACEAGLPHAPPRATGSHG